MRKKKEPLLNLLNLMPRNKIARELEAIFQVLDASQDILDPVYGDPVKYQRKDTGRNGMNAEQVLRCAMPFAIPGIAGYSGREGARG
jgi:IS5 family transposase